MPDEKHVTVEDFSKIVKGQMSMIHDLTAVVEVLKTALMRVNALPVSAEYLEKLDAEVRALPHMVAARKQIDSIHDPYKFEEFLKLFEGTIQ